VASSQTIAVETTDAPAATVWIHGPRADVALTLLWVPFSVAAALAMGNARALQVVVAATLLTSLVHQPLTLGLIYGDPDQFALAKRVFTFFPFALCGAIVVGRTISLALVGVIAGLWNAEHTLMQRYGVVRIYARKAGEVTAGSDRASERPMLLSWLAFALSFAAADPRTPGLLDRVELGATNEDGVKVLQSLRPYAAIAVVAGALAVVMFTRRWWRAERALGVQGFTPKRRYLLGTAVLFGVILVNPIVGLMGYVGSHAVEYFVIVHGALRRRYAGPLAERGGLVGRAVRSPLKATGCIVAYLVVIGGVLVLVQFRLRADLASVVLLTVGGMHVFFDGFIWKLRRPVVARSVAASVG
jgi:hypothetical protein